MLTLSEIELSQPSVQEAVMVTISSLPPWSTSILSCSVGKNCIYIPHSKASFPLNQLVDQ